MGWTNVSSDVLDPAGSVWLVSDFYQDVWRWDLSPAGTNRLHLPWTDWGYTGVPALVFANNRGQLLVHALKTNNLSYAVLLSPALNATLTASTNHLSVGDSLTVTATLTALGDSPLTGISPSGPLAWSGTGAFKVLSGPSPAPPWSLQPGAQMQAQWQCQATTNGAGRFTLTFQTPTLASLPAISQPVRIVPNGDLLIKRAVDPPDLYAGLGVFQTVPIAPQVKTNVVANMTDLSQFQVQVQNNDAAAQTFTLQAAVGGTPVWKEAFVLSGDGIANLDATTSLQAGGITLPSMDPGTALTLTVTLQDTNATVGDINTAVFTLGLANDPTVTLDAVEAVTLLVQTIIVNSTGDLPNQDPNGCCCDTGNMLADGKTPECTLRAAIDLANRQAGKQMIQFQIPSDDPGIVKGVPSIRPKAALPDITNPVVIDGWSQSPAASSPPSSFRDKPSPRGKLGHGEGGLQRRGPGAVPTCSSPGWPTGYTS